ncbi:MAG: ImmA/IrrE family metallo-endopeptidase [Planctomycetota bacterium]|nr:MAG: ImmA/IrrE family metallo-endopeptidase [Planctomycetota bacterium]
MNRTSPPSRALADAQAAWLWKLHGFRAPADLVLEDLALALGVLVVEGPLAGADARLLRNAGHGLVRIRSDIPEPGRKRFALAHELGHWLLHGLGSPLSACTPEAHVTGHDHAPEIEANQFASSLLMPEPLFRPRIRGSRPSVELLRSLASVFATSFTATAVRYVELQDDYCAVVISEGGRVLWWRGSRCFTQRFRIESGSWLSPATVAARALSGRAPSSAPEQVAFRAWIVRGRPVETFLFEQCVLLERYRQAVSLIWLP